MLLLTFADGKQIELLAEKEITANHWISILLNLEDKTLSLQTFDKTNTDTSKDKSNKNLSQYEGKQDNKIIPNIQVTSVLEEVNVNKQFEPEKVDTTREIKRDLVKNIKEEPILIEEETNDTLVYSKPGQETKENTNKNLSTEENTKNFLQIFDNLKETVEASILTLSSGNSNKETNDNKENFEQNRSSNETNQQNTNEELSENDQNTASNNTPFDDNNNPKKPPYVKLPTFFDPPPPIQYVATLEIQIKKKKRKPPKIIRKLVPASNDLERRSQLLLQGDYPCEKIDFSAASAHRKIRNIKHTFDKSDDNLKFTEDTVEKAKAKNFKNILTPAAVLPIKSRAFEYQYIIEDPKTGLCLSTSEIENFYSPEELQLLISEIEKMEQETKFSSKITTRRIKSEFCFLEK